MMSKVKFGQIRRVLHDRAHWLLSDRYGKLLIVKEPFNTTNNDGDGYGAHFISWSDGMGIEDYPVGEMRGEREQPWATNEWLERHTEVVYD